MVPSAAKIDGKLLLGPHNMTMHCQKLTVHHHAVVEMMPSINGSFWTVLLTTILMVYWTIFSNMCLDNITLVYGLFEGPVGSTVHEDDNSVFGMAQKATVPQTVVVWGPSTNFSTNPLGCRGYGLISNVILDATVIFLSGARPSLEFNAMVWVKWCVLFVLCKIAERMGLTR